MKTLIIIFAVCAAALTAMPSATYAQQTERALITSMQSRLPALMDLKLAGKVGETNQALIEGRKPLEREAQRLISAENADRRAHYTLIATRLQVSVKTVQLKRAEQIRQNSPKNIWIQSKSGDWYQE
jgi:uncharacterized protein YdbL (DUF1318 family)